MAARCVAVLISATFILCAETLSLQRPAEKETEIKATHPEYWAVQAFAAFPKQSQEAYEHVLSFPELEREEIYRRLKENVDVELKRTFEMVHPRSGSWAEYAFQSFLDAPQTAFDHVNSFPAAEQEEVFMRLKRAQRQYARSGGSISKDLGEGHVPAYVLAERAALPKGSWANEAYQCCGLGRAMQYVDSFPRSKQYEAYRRLQKGSLETRETLLASFTRYPESRCTKDYDCSFATKFVNGSFTNESFQCNIEHDTIDMYNKWIPSHARVLEVGARYGQASCYISTITAGSGHLVSVDADASIWPVWEENMRSHNCSGSLVKGVLGAKPKFLSQQGYGSGTSSKKGTGEVEVPSHSLESLGRQFDTLAADCEGCFATLLSENPGLEEQLNLIIVERHNEAEDKEIRRLVKSGWHVSESNPYAMRVLSRNKSQEEHTRSCIYRLGNEQATEIPQPKIPQPMPSAKKDEPRLLYEQERNELEPESVSILRSLARRVKRFGGAI